MARKATSWTRYVVDGKEAQQAGQAIRNTTNGVLASPSGPPWPDGTSRKNIRVQTEHRGIEHERGEHAEVVGPDHPAEVSDRE